MEPVHLHTYPRGSVEPLEHDLAEVDAAIELVRRGSAVRVALVNLTAFDRVAAVAVARCQAGDVAMTIDRSGSIPTLTIGPRH